MDRLIESLSKPLKVSSTKKLTGPFTVLNEFNQNSRRYPDDVYIPAYQELVPKIKERRLLGELDHPLEYDEVRLANVSHVVTECSIKDIKGSQVVYGTVELLDTPSGKIAQALVRAGIPLGISSRALGNTVKAGPGVDVVQLKLITYDLVAEPSFKTAILSEEKKSVLAEDLSHIESKLPLNESKKEYSSIRESICRIRESLCLSETKSDSEVPINKNIDTQTLEVDALKSLLESKKSIIKSDTNLLKNSRKRIKVLESRCEDLGTRYENLSTNHQKLQESYNRLTKSRKLEENKKIAELTEEIVTLRKRLAIEQRGMSYEQVHNLLESVRTEKEINEKLDTIASLGKRSNVVSREDSSVLFESLSNSNNTRSKLSSIISKV